MMVVDDMVWARFSNVVVVVVFGIVVGPPKEERECCYKAHSKMIKDDYYGGSGDADDKEIKSRTDSLLCVYNMMSQTSW